MEKKKWIGFLAAAPRNMVLQMAALVEAQAEVRVIRPATKTLVMLRPRDLEQACAFPETLGVSLVVGDDFQRAKAIATLDAAHTAQLPLIRKFQEMLEGPAPWDDPQWELPQGA